MFFANSSSRRFPTPPPDLLHACCWASRTEPRLRLLSTVDYKLSMLALNAISSTHGKGSCATGAESALPIFRDLKLFGINTYTKIYGGGSQVVAAAFRRAG